MAAGLLNGLSVVELDVGPSLTMALAGKLLADLGADVTRVRLRETVPAPRAESAEWELMLALVAEGKREVPLRGADVAVDPEVVGLVRGADIVLAPPDWTCPEVHLDAAAVAELNPTAVYGVAVPFDVDAESRSWRSSDLVLQALGGMLTTTGQPGEPPTKIGARVADHLGALYLAIGCLAGYLRRLRTGAGRQVLVSLVDALVSSLNNFVAEYRGKGHLPGPLGNRHLASSPWNLYPAADGYVMICLITDRQWDELAILMGRAELAGSPEFHGQHNRRPRADELDALVSSWTRTQTVADVLAALSDRGVPCGDIAHVDEVLVDGSLVDRGLLRHLPDGRLGLGPLVRIDETVPGGGVVRDPVRAAAPDGVGPLAGIRVTEIGVAAAGPVGGRILANLGAEVIKIEPAGGEVGRRVPPVVGSTSAVFHLNSSDKRSLCVELTSEPGRSIAQRVMLNSDVVHENLAPGRLASWGLNFTDVSKQNPGLIWTSVTGFGQASAGRRVRAYDTVVQAASGLMSITGFPDSIPTKAGISLSDFFGGVAGALATIAGLTARELDRSQGRPLISRHLDVAMYDVTVWTTLASWPQVLLHGERPIRRGNQDRYEKWQDVLACRDGAVALTLHDDADVARAHRLVISRETSDDPGPVADIASALATWVARRTVADAVSDLRGVGLAVAPLRTVVDLLGDEALSRRAVLTTSVHPVDGDVAVIGTPLRFSDVAIHVPSPAPALGSNTREILRDVARFTPEEVEQLLRHPAVLQP